MALQFKWIPRLLRWSDPFRKGAQESSDQYLGKSAKIQTFNDLTMAVDLRELAEADRDGVATLRAKHGMGPIGKRHGDKDAWVCDDMTINASRSGLLEMLVGAALGAIGLWFLADKLKPAAMPAPEQASASASASADLQFYQRRADGTVVPIDIPRLPPELRPQ